MRMRVSCHTLSSLCLTSLFVCWGLNSGLHAMLSPNCTPSFWLLKNKTFPIFFPLLSNRRFLYLKISHGRWESIAWNQNFLQTHLSVPGSAYWSAPNRKTPQWAVLEVTQGKTSECWFWDFAWDQVQHLSKEMLRRLRAEPKIQCQMLGGNFFKVG